MIDRLLDLWVDLNPAGRSVLMSVAEALALARSHPTQVSQDHPTRVMAERQGESPHLCFMCGHARHPHFNNCPNCGVEFPK